MMQKGFWYCGKHHYFSTKADLNTIQILSWLHKVSELEQYVKRNITNLIHPHKMKDQLIEWQRMGTELSLGKICLATEWSQGRLFSIFSSLGWQSICCSLTCFAETESSCQGNPNLPEPKDQKAQYIRSPALQVSLGAPGSVWVQKLCTLKKSTCQCVI